ncbi:hypothetical protein ACFXPQ_34495, partial [Streptomyces lydicus]
RCITVEADRLRRIPEVVAIAGGPRKAHAIGPGVRAPRGTRPGPAPRPPAPLRACGSRPDPRGSVVSGGWHTSDHGDH